MKIREFRAEAREALKGNWCVAVVAGIVFSLFAYTYFSIYFLRIRPLPYRSSCKWEYLNTCNII